MAPQANERGEHRVDGAQAFARIKEMGYLSLAHCPMPINYRKIELTCWQHFAGAGCLRRGAAERHLLLHFAAAMSAAFAAQCVMPYRLKGA